MSLNVKGQLKEAQVENLSSDPANLPHGRTWYNTTLNKIKTSIAGVAKIIPTTDSTDTFTNKTHSFPIVQDTFSFLDQGSDVSAPSAGYKNLYTKAAGFFYRISAGTVRQIANLDEAQVFTNKDIDGGTASNTSRITIPKDTLANLNALTRKAGTIVYATDTGFFYYDNGTNLIAPSSNPMTTQGDIIIGGASGVATRLAGAVGVLQGAVGSGPSYTQSPSLVTPTVSNIQFPSTQVASSDVNNLDDYEEGTFTPTIYGLSTSGAGTYAQQVGVYTKIGRQVICNVYIDITNHTGTGSIGLGGFPFTSTGTLAATPMGYTDRLSYAGAERTIAGYMANGGTTAILIQSGSALGAATVSMDTSFGLIYTICYNAS